MDDARGRLRAALSALVGDGRDGVTGRQRLDALSEAFEAFLAGRAVGDESALDLRAALPASPALVTLNLEFAATAIWQSLGGEWHDQTFRNAAQRRSGLQAMADATGVDADLEVADAALRTWGDEGYLTPQEIPDVPTSHWWWWLPGEPPRS